MFDIPHNGNLNLKSHIAYQYYPGMLMENDFYMFKHLSPPYYSPGRVRQILLKKFFYNVSEGCILFRIGLPRITVLKGSISCGIEMQSY